ncbi:MAG: hypothetical protein IJ909_10945, partial [Fibrobacter sp.]|nr:hypothetical protein [Fibrobacter sp.]
MDGHTAVLDRDTRTFTVTLPTATDFSSIVLNFTIFGDTVFADGTELVNGVTEVDASAPVTLVVKKGKTETPYTLKVQNTGLPVVRINTPGSRSVASKETWMEG